MSSHKITNLDLPIHFIFIMSFQRSSRFKTFLNTFEELHSSAAAFFFFVFWLVCGFKSQLYRRQEGHCTIYTSLLYLKSDLVRARGIRILLFFELRVSTSQSYFFFRVQARFQSRVRLCHRRYETTSSIQM